MCPAPFVEQGHETLFFVDVDGVLNVGIKDEGNAPLLLRDDDVTLAFKLMKSGYTGRDYECIKKLIEMADHQIGHGEGEATYQKFVTQGTKEVADVLAGRLAKLIQAAGDQQQVVLSSSWRRPQHRVRRKLLEQAIGRQLDRTFQFDTTTPLNAVEKSAEDRLRVIGDYLAEVCKKRSPEAAPLRVLVLEDFFITPMRGWKCGGMVMDSVVAAERYLQGRVPTTAGIVAVKLVHTYDEWKTENGAQMQVGCGLREGPFCEAMDFISAAATQAPGNEVLLGHLDRNAMIKAHHKYFKQVDAVALEENEVTYDGKDKTWMQLASAFLPMITPMIVHI